MAGVAMVESKEYWLDGNIVRIRISSGGETIDHAMSIGTFVETQIKARAVVAQWHVRPSADVVQIGSRKGR